MAKTIEELNFKLKVDDAAFKAQMKADKDAASELSKTIQKYLEIKRASGTLSDKEYQTLKRLDNLESNRRVNAEKELAAQAKRLAAEEKLAQVKDKTNQHQRVHNRLLGEAASIAASYVSIWGAKKLLSELVQVTGEFEMQRTTLKAMLQDANGANAIYEQIKQLAVVSPFGFKELVTYTKQLAAYSVPIGELYDTTKMLADVSAGLGVGMDRLVLAYGQVRSAAFLRGQEVRQFTEAGIPILDMLAKQFEEIEGRMVSAGEVFDKISKRQVSFEMVAKVFKDMTSEGGKFYNMQEIQAETLKGKISNLKDAYEIMLNEIGQNLEPVMKGAVDTLRDLMSNYENVGKQILVMAASYGVARTAITLFTASSIQAGIANTALLKGLSGIKAFVTKNPYALLAAGVAALAGGIYKLATAQTVAERATAGVNKAIADFDSSVAEDETNLRFLIKQLDSAKKGTQEYEKAKRQLYSEYGTYITKIDAENIALGKTAEAYQNIALAVRDANREKALSGGLTDISNVYRDEYDNIFRQLRGTLQSLDINPNGAIAKQLGKYIRGEVNVSDLSKEAIDVITRVKQLLDAKMKTSGGMFGNGISFYGVDIDALRENLKIAEDIAIDARQSLADALEVIYGPTLKEGAGGGVPGGGNDDNSSAIEALQKRIALLEKLRDVYESMRPYFSNEQIRDFFATNFGFADKSLWENFDFTAQIDTLLPKLDALGEKGVEAANAIREKLATALGKDMVDNAKKAAKELEEAQKVAQTAAEKYRAFMEDWLSGTGIEGEGSEYKLSKIVSDYSKALDKIANKADDARQKLYAKADAEKNVGVWSALGFSQDYNEITERETADNANALATYSEKGREAIKKMYEEWRNGAMDFNNLSDKTLGQLRDMRTLIDGFSTDNEDVFSPEVLANLKTLGIDLEKVEEILNKLKGQDISKLKIDKETIKQWQAIVSETSNAANAIKDYADAIGSDALSSAMEGLIGMSEIASSVLSRLSQGDVPGAVVAGVSTLFQKVMDAFTASARLNAAIADAAREAEKVNAALRLEEGVDTIFGENTLARMRNAVDLMKDYENAVNADRNQANKSLTWKSGLFNWGRSSKSLSAMVSELGYDLYDVYGNLNSQALQAILDTYESLTSADREWVESAIQNSELYADAMGELEDVLTDIYGNTIDSITDQLIESWKQAGDAALDYTDILDEVATAYARMILKAAVIDQVFTPEVEARLKQLAKEGDVTGALDLTKQKLEEVKGKQEVWTEILSGLDEYFSKTAQDAGNLASGIKGITEDTANLLASYLNAIRADVSYSKVQRDNILAEIKNMASYVASPTLLDYLNRIQANTFDTAEHTRDILSRLDSVMALGNDGMAFRVYS